jgi:GNAT superfamily N-acetyltransferase
MSIITDGSIDSAQHTTASVTIRPFVESDYPAVVALRNAAWEDYPIAEAEWRHWDATRDPKTKFARFVAVDGESGQMVGVASYFQWAELYHPRKFHFDVDVLPEWQGRGLATRLYDHLLQALEPFDPLLLRCVTRVDRERSVAFLHRRGFAEEMRVWESRLTVAAFDPAAYSDAEAHVAAQGIVIRTLAELRDSDPAWAEKLFELDWTVALDMPSADTLTQPTFDHWYHQIADSPNWLPEGWFIAIDGDRYVGESCLWRKQTGGDLNVGATGVLREYRRRGIALALKLRACTFAKAYGCHEMRTENAQSNRAMLSINERLGFVKVPAWVWYAKQVGEDALAEAARRSSADTAGSDATI